MESDEITVSVSDSTFRLSKTLLSTCSTYFEEEFKKDLTRTEYELTELRADVCAALFAYIEDGSLEVRDKDSQFLSDLLHSSRILGVHGFTLDVQHTLRKEWFRMKSLETAFAVADAIQFRTELLDKVVHDVINLLLGDKRSTSMDTADLTYEMLICLTKGNEFWVVLNLKCTYSFTYESFYDAAITWINRNRGDETQIQTLIQYLRLETINPEFVFSVLNRNSRTGEKMYQDLLKAIIRTQYQNIKTSIKKTIPKMKVILTNSDDKSVVVKELSEDTSEWNEVLTVDLNFEPNKVTSDEDHIYVIGLKEIITVYVHELREPRRTECSESLAVQEVCLQGRYLYVFGKIKSKMVLLRFDSESNKFDVQSDCPVDDSVSAASFKDSVYVTGKSQNGGEKGFTVYRYNESSKEFDSVTFISKHWINDNIESLKTISRYEKTQISVCENRLYVIFYDQIVNFQGTLYIAEIKCDMEGREETFADKRLQLKAMDKYSSLEISQAFGEGDILFIWSRNSINDLSVSLYKEGVLDVQQLGFLPKFVNGERLQYCYIDTKPKASDDKSKHYVDITRDDVTSLDVYVDYSVRCVTEEPETVLASNFGMQVYAKNDTAEKEETVLDGAMVSRAVNDDPEPERSDCTADKLITVRNCTSQEGTIELQRDNNNNNQNLAEEEHIKNRELKEPVAESNVEEKERTVVDEAQSSSCHDDHVLPSVDTVIALPTVFETDSLLVEDDSNSKLKDNKDIEVCSVEQVEEDISGSRLEHIQDSEIGNVKPMKHDLCKETDSLTLDVIEISKDGNDAQGNTDIIIALPFEKDSLLVEQAEENDSGNNLKDTIIALPAVFETNRNSLLVEQVEQNNSGSKSKDNQVIEVLSVEHVEKEISGSRLEHIHDSEIRYVEPMEHDSCKETGSLTLDIAEICKKDNDVQGNASEILTAEVEINQQLNFSNQELETRDDAYITKKEDLATAKPSDELTTSSKEETEISSKDYLITEEDCKPHEETKVEDNDKVEDNAKVGDNDKVTHGEEENIQTRKLDGPETDNKDDLSEIQPFDSEKNSSERDSFRDDFPSDFSGINDIVEVYLDNSEEMCNLYENIKKLRSQDLVKELEYQEQIRDASEKKENVSENLDSNETGSNSIQKESETKESGQAAGQYDPKISVCNEDNIEETENETKVLQETNDNEESGIKETSTYNCPDRSHNELEYLETKSDNKVPLLYPPSSDSKDNEQVTSDSTEKGAEGGLERTSDAIPHQIRNGDKNCSRSVEELDHHSNSEDELDKLENIKTKVKSCSGISSQGDHRRRHFDKSRDESISLSNRLPKVGNARRASRSSVASTQSDGELSLGGHNKKVKKGFVLKILEGFQSLT